MQILIDFCDARASVNTPGADGTSTALRCAFDAPRQTLVAHTPEQVKPVLDAVAACAAQGLWCVGYLRYEAASAFDAALLTHPADGPLAWFGVFDQALPWPQDTQGNSSASPVQDAAANIGTSLPQDTRTSPSTAPTTLQWQRPLTRSQFDAHMHSIHQAIAAGEFYQVNYTAPLLGELTGDAATLFTRLQRAQPGGYAAYINTGAEQILSVSPELFFDWQGDHILTRPMKGTAPRGDTAAQDQARAQALVASPKERAENVMIVDLLRNDLSRIAQPHTVKVPALFQVQTLPTVLQMVSDVTARTRAGTTLSDVFGALFPCGSITGAPKVRAMQMIHTLEPQPRGVYCGAIGVVRPGGHATFNVAIRTVTLRGSRATCGIGSGITADASAAAEWQEWQHKRAFLERASDDFKLLETLRLQDGQFHLLALHLARLHSAARHFGYPFDEARIRQALQALLPASPTHPAGMERHQHLAGDAGAHTELAAVESVSSLWRVRLLLDAQGMPHAEKFIQNSTPAQVLLAQAAIPFEASSSEFTRFKTTHRAHYEAFAPTDPAVFDTLLYNAQGELTECTRGNIAVLLDGQWLTPALHCGLLPGVGRADFITQGRLKEAVITLADLPRVQGWAFVNSLRGWVDARVVGGG
jgi:para-aminobenzoate synthetase/4-amino-4-deoxychorismate lyase